MADIIEHFDVLTKNGLQVIPLNAGGKNPVFPKWQIGYDQYRSRSYIENHPECNLGVKLGTILDLEGDSAHANQSILEMIGDYPHPSYSSCKSLHHLFQNPFSNLSRIMFQNMEFRGQKHQSVLPPSIILGTSYKWITIDFPVPPLPDRLLSFLKKIRRNDVKPDHLKVNCSVCGEVCYLHKRRFALELDIFKSMEMLWACQKCRSLDLRPLCRKLAKKAF